MSGRILSLTFDKACFPLSPRFTRFHPLIEDGKITFIGLEPEGKPDDYTTRFGCNETGILKKLPYSDYHLTAQTLPDDNQFKIEFTVASACGTEESKLEFDVEKYYLSYLNFSNIVQASDPSEIQKAENIFNIKFMQRVFSEDIEGNDLFWGKFASDIDRACVPMNYKISMNLWGLPVSEITCINSRHKDSSVVMQPIPDLQ